MQERVRRESVSAGKENRMRKGREKRVEVDEREGRILPVDWWDASGSLQYGTARYCIVCIRYGIRYDLFSHSILFYSGYYYVYSPVRLLCLYQELANQK